MKRCESERALAMQTTRELAQAFRKSERESPDKTLQRPSSAIYLLKSKNPFIKRTLKKYKQLGN